MTEYLLAISIQYYKQTSDENKENHQFQDYLLIQYQILQTNIIKIAGQTVGRVINEILERKC